MILSLKFNENLIRIYIHHTTLALMTASLSTEFYNIYNIHVIVLFLCTDKYYLRNNKTLITLKHSPGFVKILLLLNISSMYDKRFISKKKIEFHHLLLQLDTSHLNVIYSI